MRCGQGVEKKFGGLLTGLALKISKGWFHGEFRVGGGGDNIFIVGTPRGTRSPKWKEPIMLLIVTNVILV